MPRPGRPLGDIAQALIEAAGQKPGTVAELAARAQVGRAPARMTCSRLVTRGQLVVVNRKRPIELQAVAGVCTPVVDAAQALASAMFGICGGGHVPESEQ